MQCDRPAIKSIILFTLLTIGSIACKPGEPKAADNVAVEPMLIGAENTVYVRKEALSTGPRLSGSLEPREQARVRAEISGSVTAVKGELGQNVKRGQVLARIEDRAIRNAFASARAAQSSAAVEVQNAKRQTERTEVLVKGGALAQRDLELAQGNQAAAQARFAQTQALLADAQKQVEAATVASPIDGIISEKFINLGDVVSIGAALFTVLDPTSMRLQASVPSEALPLLKIGTSVSFMVRGYPDRSFQGKIEQIAPAADPTTRQITTLVSIPNPGRELIAGLFAEGRIDAETRETLVVPIDAVNKADDDVSVVRIKDGSVETVRVKLGLIDRETERVEIQGPVQEGDVLLRGAILSIPPGTPVTLTGNNPNASR